MESAAEIKATAITTTASLMVEAKKAGIQSYERLAKERGLTEWIKARTEQDRVRGERSTKRLASAQELAVAQMKQGSAGKMHGSTNVSSKTQLDKATFGEDNVPW